MSDVMLSIYVATYNHEKYITQALDSILMQETQYSYEVLVGEDCSQDNTRQVLKEYEKQHPGKFNIFYRDHNMYHDEIKNGEELKRRCKGKYIIALEGDDYWTDSCKIEKQITFLEEHPEYIAVSHDCVVVDEFSRPNGEVYPGCKDEEYTIRHFASEIMPGQLTTVMYRNFYAHDVIDASLCKKGINPGDQTIYFSLISNGKIFCMKETMSAYRHITANGTSFSATYTYKYESLEILAQALIDYAVRIKNNEAKKYAEFIYMRNLYSGYKDKQITLKEVITKTQNLSSKFGSILMCIKFIVNKKIFKKSVRV